MWTDYSDDDFGFGFLFEDSVDQRALDEAAALVADELPDTTIPGVIGAWNRIVARAMEAMRTEDVNGDWESGDLLSINDEIQREYRHGLITEAERDWMRAQVRDLLAETDRYACGLWAPSAAPMGAVETGIILMMLQLLAEDAAEQLAGVEVAA